MFQIKNVYSVLVFFIFLISPSICYPSAWILEDKDQAIYKFNFYQADEARGVNSSKVSIPKVTKFEATVYKEKFIKTGLLYGYDFTLTSEHNQISSSDDNGRSFFFKENMFIRYNLFNDLRNILSTQLTLSLPILYKTDLTYGEATKETLATELRLMYGVSFKLADYNAYLNSEIGYNYYVLDNIEHNFKIDQRFGVHLNEKNSIALALYSEKDSKSIWLNSGAMLAQNFYDLIRLELAYSYNVTNDTRVSLALYQDLYGRSTSIGNGLVAFVTKEFRTEKNKKNKQ